jgi:hypothetical protein
MVSRDCLSLIQCIYISGLGRRQTGRPDPFEGGKARNQKRKLCNWPGLLALAFNSSNSSANLEEEGFLFDGVGDVQPNHLLQGGYAYACNSM